MDFFQESQDGSIGKEKEMKDLKEELNSLSDMCKCDISVNEMEEELSKIIELVKQDSALVSRLSKENKIIVFKATDTGRTVTIELKDGNILGYIGEPRRCDLRFEATESVYLGILSGEIDPDAVFFGRKINIYGSIMDAVGLKNIFLSKVQSKM